MKSQIEYTVDDWIAWASKNDIRTEVIAFIRSNPTFLCIPKMWEVISGVLNVSISHELKYHLIEEYLGDNTFTKFSKFLVGE